MIIIDTNIAIDLRDAEPETAHMVSTLGGPPALAMISRIELESGVYRDSAHVSLRRRLLDRPLATVPVVMFTAEDMPPMDGSSRLWAMIGSGRSTG